MLSDVIAAVLGGACVAVATPIVWHVWRPERRVSDAELEALADATREPGRAEATEFDLAAWERRYNEQNERLA